MDWEEFRKEMVQNVPRGTFFGGDPLALSGTPPKGGEADFSVFWDRLKIFHDFFLEQAQKINLMGPGGIEKILTDHFYDCLVGFPYMGMGPGKKFVDLGTGGGFPGMLLKIYEPGLELDLVEAKGKKVAFLKEAAVRLGFSDINVYQMGIENVSKSPDFRGQYDGVTARGLSDMGTLLKWTKPLLKVGGGKAYFYKAEGWRGEALRRPPRPFPRDSCVAGTPPEGGEREFFEVNLDHHGLGRRLVVWGGG